MRAAGFVGRTVVLKVRFADFTTITRSRTFDEPTDVGQQIYRQAKQVLDGWDCSGPGYGWWAFVWRSSPTPMMPRNNWNWGGAHRDGVKRNRWSIKRLAATAGTPFALLGWWHPALGWRRSGPAREPGADRKPGFSLDAGDHRDQPNG